MSMPPKKPVASKRPSSAVRRTEAPSVTRRERPASAVGSVTRTKTPSSTQAKMTVHFHGKGKEGAAQLPWYHRYELHLVSNTNVKAPWEGPGDVVELFLTIRCHLSDLIAVEPTRKLEPKELAAVAAMVAEARPKAEADFKPLFFLSQSLLMAMAEYVVDTEARSEGAAFVDEAAAPVSQSNTVEPEESALTEEQEEEEEEEEGEGDEADEDGEGDDSDVDGELKNPVRPKKGEEADDPFAVEAAAGEEFMAVKPYKGQIFQPTNPPKFNKKTPEDILKLEWVHGYRGHDARNNLFYLNGDPMACVYHAAAVGIVYDIDDRVQRFFMGHDDDILCLAQHPSEPIVATGQIGKKPTIRVWNAVTMAELACLSFHQRGVTAVAFSPDGKYLMSAGMDDDHMVALWDWQEKKKLAEAKGSKDKIMDMEFSPDGKSCITVGVKHFKEWTIPSLKGKKGAFGKKGKLSTFLCVTYNSDGTALVGTKGGEIYQFRGNELAKVIPQSTGPLQAIYVTSSGKVATGGKDGKVRLLNSKLQEESSFDLDALTDRVFDVNGREKSFSEGKAPHIKSISWENGRVLIGTRSNEILEVDEAGQELKIFVQGHAQGSSKKLGEWGELWGLATHPNKPIIVTGSDDRTVRTWDLKAHQMLSHRALKDQIRTVDVSPDGNYIAAGGKQGDLYILDCQTLKEICQPAKKRGKKTRKEVSVVKFSPNGKFLAVGTHHREIEVYAVDREFMQIGVFEKHTATVTHIDWDDKSEVMRSTSADYNVLYCDYSGETHLTSSGSVKDLAWFTTNCTFGWEVQGIYPEFSDGTDVNSVDRSLDDGSIILATGDDFGQVKLFNYPALEGAECVSYGGHSSHVTNVRFGMGDRYLLSSGGGDLCVFQWRHYEDEDATVEVNEDPELLAELGVDKSAGEESAPPAGDVGEMDLFGVEEAAGEESMAVKPWKGAIFPPSKPPPENNSKPESWLELDWVYGYRGHDCRGNVFYNVKGDIVYHAAGVGIVQNAKDKKQTFFRAHDDDIVSMDMHPNGKYVATGQLGKDPSVFIWDSTETKDQNPDIRDLGIKPIAKLVCPKERGIVAVAFSADGSKVVTVGNDNDHTVTVWDINYEKGKATILAKEKGHQDKVLHAKISDKNELVFCGIKVIKFASVDVKGGNKTHLKFKKGIFGKKGKLQVIIGVNHLPDGTTLAGTSDGSIYQYNGNNLTKAVNAHQGPLQCIAVGPNRDFLFVHLYELLTVFFDTTVIATGGKDGKVRFWDHSLKSTKEINVTELAQEIQDEMGRKLCFFSGKTIYIKSIALGEFEKDEPGKMVIGTKDNEIYEIDLTSEKPKLKIIVQGHSQGAGSTKLGEWGELWGLQPSSNKNIFVSAGDDRTMRLWDMETRSILAVRRLEEQARSCSYSPDGKYVAVGFKDGSFCILETQTLNVCVTLKDRKEEIGEIKFSPCGKLLEVGSHDNYIDIYSTTKLPESIRRVGKCKGHSSYITHVDFSKDSQYLRSTCGAYELLFWDNSGTQIKRPSSLCDTEWATETCILGWGVQGIFPPYSDGTDVNAVDRSHDGDELVTSDDFGKVNLFRYPALEGAECLSFAGHSSHVTNIRFSYDDRYVISAGGADLCLFQWKHFEVRGQEDEDAYDSDVEAEVEASAVPKREAPAPAPAATPSADAGGMMDMFSVEESAGEEFMAVKPWKGAIFPPSDPPKINTKKPDSSLTLEFVHGYRGHDARNNIFYSAEGHVCFHAAGVGIVYDKQSHTQKFFMGHNDDILCMAVSKDGKIAVTGQVGKKPAVIVWDTATCQELARMENHKRGVVGVAISPNGKYIASVGNDNDHTLIVWEWGASKLTIDDVGTSKDKVFACEYSPSGNEVALCGIKYVAFFKCAEGKLVDKRGSKGKLGKDGKRGPFLHVQYVDDAVKLVGTVPGDLYPFMGDQLSKPIKKAHDGPLQAITVAKDGNFFMTGGKDGVVQCWDAKLKKQDSPFKPINFSSKELQTKYGLQMGGTHIRAIALNEQEKKCTVGFFTGEVVEVDSSGKCTMLTQGHGQGSSKKLGDWGEVWGLAVHPRANIIASAGDDRTVRLWDPENRKLLRLKSLKEQCRAVAFAPDGDLLVVGTKDGVLYVLNGEDLSEVTMITDKKRTSEVSDIKFSPDGSHFAVGSHDNYIDIYDVGKYKKSAVCKGHSSYITHIDWSADSQKMRSNCGAYELLFWSVDGTQIKRPSSLCDEEWASSTCVLGWDVQGIYPPCSDGTDVNAVDRSRSKSLMATGDDFGNVNLFNYPVAEEDAEYKSFTGHSSHVTNVRFSVDDSRVFSTGGGDLCVFQWLHESK